eukprot:6484976-Amphidinium_carterae.2
MCALVTRVLNIPTHEEIQQCIDYDKRLRHDAMRLHAPLVSHSASERHMCACASFIMNAAAGGCAHCASPLVKT